MEKNFILFTVMLWVGFHIYPQINILHSFTGGAADGSTPYGSLIQDGATLYGMTKRGGDFDDGTIFKISTDGSDFTFLHSFCGGASDGNYPKGSLIQDGAALYGMTSYGGDSYGGNVFKIDTDGSGYTMLHDFAGPPGDGHEPWGDLVQDGAALYGMTSYGGDSDMGTIFKINTDGSGFTLLHEFAGGASDGAYPKGSLILDGAALYGMTNRGGDFDEGTIFKIDTDGSGFTLLHEFTGGEIDGAYPRGSLILDGATLYGMTTSGGSADLGVIFSYGLLRSITVTSPSGGEIWDAGKTQDITWDAAGVTGLLKISLWQDGVKVGNIALINDLNARSYSWKVGEYNVGTADPGTGYSIKIKEKGTANSDMSDGPFEITKLYGVLSPNGGENLLIGTTWDITWNVPPSFSGDIGIALMKVGVKVGDIALITDPTARSYSWTVGDYIGGTASPGTGYKIKIKVIGTSNSDLSDTDFTLNF